MLYGIYLQGSAMVSVVFWFLHKSNIYCIYTSTLTEYDIKMTILFLYQSLPHQRHDTIGQSTFIVFPFKARDPCSQLLSCKWNRSYKNHVFRNLLKIRQRFCVDWADMLFTGHCFVKHMFCFDRKFTKHGFWWRV